MKSSKRFTEPNSLAAELHSDDGQDPKEFFRKSNQTRKSGRKALQLCSQVADTLSLVLSGECASEVLQNLLVANVTPAPDASQLLVLLTPAPGSRSVSAEEVLAAVHAASGRLRTEVAGAISRKRAPRLVFQFLPLVEQKERDA
jgi:ribosome-binding factor A